MNPFAAHLALPALLASTLVAGAAAQSAPEPAASSAAPQPAAETAPFPARLSDVEGTVRTARIQPQSATQAAPTGQLPPPPPSDQAFRTALVNTPVAAGTEVDTGSDGRAELQFNDGNIARITPNSAVEVLALPNGGEQLRALRGLSYFEVPDASVGVMTVRAGAYGARIEQNTLLRFDLDATPFQVAVIRGAAHVTSSNSDVGFEATEGQTAALDPSSPTSYDLNQEVANNSWDAWNTDRDQTLAQLAETQTNARVGSGDANSPGWNDLDYYGTWYNVPGAGMAWAPDGVDASFDPYGSGAWTSYPGVGPTWVSAYPWGWLPYHCGGWNYFSGFGWGWQPGGGCGGYGGGVGWYPYTGVHHAPRDYRIPLPMDPRLRTRLTGTPLPPSRPVAVNRTSGYRFRPIGGARPEPRAFPLANNNLAVGSSTGFAPTLPPVGLGFAAAGRQAYQPGTGLHGAPGGGVGGGMHNNHIEGGRGFYTPGPGAATPPSGVTSRLGAITPPPHVLAAPRNSIAPPPHIVAPPAVHYAPPPAAAAPRVATPAAAPRGH